MANPDISAAKVYDSEDKKPKHEQEVFQTTFPYLRCMYELLS